MIQLCVPALPQKPSLGRKQLCATAVLLYSSTRSLPLLSTPFLFLSALSSSEDDTRRTYPVHSLCLSAGSFCYLNQGHLMPKKTVATKMLKLACSCNVLVAADPWVRGCGSGHHDPLWLLGQLFRGQHVHTSEKLYVFTCTPPTSLIINILFSPSALPTDNSTRREHVVRRRVSRSSSWECRKHFIY